MDNFNATILPENTSKETLSSILELVQTAAKDYIDKEGALKAIDFAGKEFESFTFSNDLKDLYSLDISLLQDYNSIPNIRAIGTWLNSNKSDYFAKPIYEEDFDTEIGEVYEILAGFDLKIKSPYKTIKIDIIGRYPNLISYKSCIAFFISKKSIAFFYCLTNYIDEGWDNKIPNNKDVQWLFIETKVSNIELIKTAVDSIKTYIQDTIIEELKSKLELSSTKE